MGETFSERKKGGTLFEKTSLFQKNIRIKQYNLEIRKKGAEVDVALLRGVVRDSVFWCTRYIPSNF